MKGSKKQPNSTFHLPSSQSPLVVIVGETASGKSDLAMEIARRYDGEIICGDSRTVYAGLDIGTAKPSKQDQLVVPHHLLDAVTPDQTFTAAEFKRLANGAIQDISSRGKLPVLVGGTGLYIDSVLYDYQFAGSDAKRDKQNPRHLERSVARQQDTVIRNNTLILGVSIDRQELEDRIQQRVERMFAAGLTSEAAAISEAYGWGAPGLMTIGYRELRPVIMDEQTEDTAKQQIAQSTKAYAKRQRTWFKRNKSIHWLTNNEQANELVQNFLSKVSSPS